MPVTLDFDDFDVFDLTESVTYTVYDPQGGTTAHTGVTALFITQAASSVLGEVAGTLKRVPVHLRAGTLPGVVPAMGDRITRADGRVYVVLPDGVQLATDETRWELQAQLLETA